MNAEKRLKVKIEIYYVETEARGQSSSGVLEQILILILTSHLFGRGVHLHRDSAPPTHTHR